MGLHSILIRRSSLSSTLKLDSAIQFSRRYTSNLLSYDKYPPKQNPTNTASAKGTIETIVFMHGILGTRRNWRTPSNLFLKRNGNFQAYTLDHRGHGGSRAVGQGNVKSATLDSCADDLQHLFTSSEISPTLIESTPDILCAHSFGGKVTLRYLQFRLVNGLPLPRHTWVLDSLPGLYSDLSQDLTNSVQGIFLALHKAPSTFPAAKDAIIYLKVQGIPLPIAQWLCTGLIQSPSGYTWGFDLPVVSALFESFCLTDFWPFLQTFDGRGRGVGGTDSALHFVRAGKNNMWLTPHSDSSGSPADRLSGLAGRGSGIQLHSMEHCGHWLHVDDPEGLVALIADRSRQGKR